jgi:hypothetical protein
LQGDRRLPVALRLRFNLTAIGLDTEIPVLDERHLFTGASLVVYVAAAVPGIVLIALQSAPCSSRALRPAKR